MKPAASIRDRNSVSVPKRIYLLLHNEFGSIRLRLYLLHFLCSFMPRYSCCRIRTNLYRLFGVSIGARSMLFGALDMSGQGRIWDRLRIGDDCLLNVPLHADLNGDINIGNNVAIGHNVVFVTSDHQVGDATVRCGDLQPKPITIGDGCWVGASVTILPGVTIGHGSVVVAGSVVGTDVPPNKLVGGVPARVIKSLSEE